MVPNSNIVDNIGQMKKALEADLAAVRAGHTIDISKLPDKLVTLHRQVSDDGREDKEALSHSLEELLELLDQIAQEIHRRYEGVNQQLKILDPDGSSGD
ncbi:MAG: hypothetical protein JJ879_08285 [Sneathiella sp.]|nr:hypothetical protein [Sneathiella sp.]